MCVCERVCVGERESEREGGKGDMERERETERGIEGEIRKGRGATWR